MRFDPKYFCKLLLDGASHETKIGCISLVWAGANKYKFSLLLCTGPLSHCERMTNKTDACLGLEFLTLILFQFAINCEHIDMAFLVFFGSFNSFLTSKIFLSRPSRLEMSISKYRHFDISFHWIFGSSSSFSKVPKSESLNRLP